MYTVGEHEFDDFFEAVHFAAKVALTGAKDGVVLCGEKIVAIIRSSK